MVKKATPKDNKRKFVRIDRNALVSFEKFPEGKEPMSDMGLARTVDVSGGGIQLELPRPIAVGDGVKLVLSFSGKLVPVAGRVMRIEQEFGGFVLAGIKLTRIDPEYKNLFDKLEVKDSK